MPTTNERENVLIAMSGGKPEHTPIFISAYWDYWVRAVNADPIEYAFGGMAKQIEIDIAGARRHAGAGLYRATSPQHIPEPVRIRPADLPTAGPPPWTTFIERYAPHMVRYDEAASRPVQSEEDIADVVDADLAHLNIGTNIEHLGGIVKGVGQEVVVAASGFAPFPHSRRALGGVERAMYALAERPALVEAVMDALLERYSAMILACAAAGADAIWCGAYNEGADMISPRMWRKLIYPRHERLVKMAHAAGLKAICWFLGDCLPLVEDIARAGYDALMLEESRIGYRSDVGEMRRRVGNALCLGGWVPELAMIRDDRETIVRHIEEQMEAAGRNGAFIFSTSMLDSNVHPDTVDFFCETVRRLDR